MALIKAINYDPTTAVSKSGASTIAMTALDTTNLRITFEAPESGNVLVRIRTALEGTTTPPKMFLGILEGTTVRMRLVPMGLYGYYGSSLAQFHTIEAVFTQTGLTPGATYTWDAAYGVDRGENSNLKYGGPNDPFSNNAYGAFVYEIWEA